MFFLNSNIIPINLDINPITKQIFVIDGGSKISSIKYYTDNNNQIVSYTNMTKSEPKVINSTDILVSPNNNKVYVTSDINDIVSVIDGFDLNDIQDIKDSWQPGFMGLDSTNDLLYISHSNNDTITMINTTTNKENPPIKLQNNPNSIFANSDTNIAYILDNDGIFTINGNTKNISIGVKFNINPSNSGYLECNNKRYSDSDYAYFNLYVSLNCIPKTLSNNNTKYQFSSLNYLNNTISANDSKPPYTLNLTNYGTITASFKPSEAEPLLQGLIDTINNKYHDLLYVFASAAIIGPIIGWAIPHTLLFREKRKQLKYLNTFFPLIDDVYNKNHQTKDQCISLLEQQRNQLITLLQYGFLNDVTFRLLNSRIIEYITRINRG